MSTAVVVSRLHDDVSIGRSLSALDRSRARACRADVQAAMAGPRHPRAAGRRVAVSGPLSPRAGARGARAAVCRRSARETARDARPRTASLAADHARRRARRRVSRERHAPTACCAARRLRADRARPRHQRRHDSLAQSRGCGRRFGPGLLRLDRSSSRPRARLRKRSRRV